MVHNLNFSKTVGWLFGTLVLVMGIMNLLRGNDPGLGAAYLVLSAVYFPPVNVMLKECLASVLKAILAFLLLWGTLAVGAITEGYYPEIVGSF